MGLFFSDEELERFAVSETGESGWVPLHSFQWFTTNARPIYLFGAGGCGRNIMRYLGRDASLRARLVGFLDNNPSMARRRIEGLPVFRPEEPGVAVSHPVVILCAADWDVMTDMAAQCDTLGLECARYSVLMHERYRGLSAKQLEENRDTVEALELWSDPVSRELYRAAIRRQVTLSDADMPPRIDADQYFQPFVPQHLYRCFVDGGAYDGDTLSEVVKRYGTILERYYAFEPNPQWAHAIAKEADARVRVYNLALSDRAGELRFLFDEVHPVSSYVDAGDGGIRVPAAALDATLGNADPVTFLKLDVEGSEMAALAGARQTILRQRPGLAICVYHRADDMWKIPLWIRRLDVGYDLFLRCHYFTGDETVCYAVPRG